MGTPLNLARAGPRGGPPVVLLHSLSLDLTYWDGQFAALAADRDVVAPDLPGHGRSPGGPGDMTFDRLADAIADLVASLGAGPADVVGLSVGGMIAQAVAVRHPAAVRSLALIGTAATFAEPARAAIRDRARAVREGRTAALVGPFMERWFTPAFRGRRPDVLDRAAKTMLGTDPAVHAALWDAVAGLDLIDALPAVGCPVRVLVGADDPSTPPAAARAIADAVPGAAVDVIPDASHLCPIEAPAAVTRLLTRFLAGVDSDLDRR